jgi:hypothetical protein
MMLYSTLFLRELCLILFVRTSPSVNEQHDPPIEQTKVFLN